MKPEAWTKRLKGACHYYDARAHFLEGRFTRALRETDVFLVGHPKSGNTWLAYLLALVLFPKQADQITLANLRRFIPDASSRDHVIAKHQQLSNPRAFRNHQPVYSEHYHRMIYLVRDPRSVLVSLWHHYRVARQDKKTRVEEVVDEYLTHDRFDAWMHNLDRWDHHVTRFALSPTATSNLLLIKYEDLVHDRHHQLDRLVKFLDINITLESLNTAEERGSFKAMRHAEERHGVEHFRKLQSSGEPFIRSGKIDGWREELSPATADRIEQSLRPVMEHFGYL